MAFLLPCAMKLLRVLEYHADGIWTMPFLWGLARVFCTRLIRPTILGPIDRVKDGPQLASSSHLN